VSAPSQTLRVTGQPHADDHEGSVAGAPSAVLFRALNEEVARIADSFAFDEELELVCECDRRLCLARISASRDAYEAVRKFPTRFLLKAEHIGADDRVVEQMAGYVVVEKIGRSAEGAIRLDPRRHTAREEPR
jgi:hypothetical protein